MSLPTLSEAICALLRLPFERNTSTGRNGIVIQSAFVDLHVGDSLDALMTNEKYVLFSKRILSVCTHARRALSPTHSRALTAMTLFVL